jgi:hypothetical protein
MVSEMRGHYESCIRAAYEAEPDELRTMLDESKSLSEKYSRPGAGSALFREGAQPRRGSFAAKNASASANHKSARTGAAIRSGEAGLKTSGGKRKADEGKADFNYPEKKKKKPAITTTKGLKESLLPIQPAARAFANSDWGKLGNIGHLPHALSWLPGGETGPLTRSRKGKSQRDA